MWQKEYIGTFPIFSIFDLEFYNSKTKTFVCTSWRFSHMLYSFIHFFIYILQWFQEWFTKFLTKRDRYPSHTDNLRVWYLVEGSQVPNRQQSNNLQHPGSPTRDQVLSEQWFPSCLPTPEGGWFLQVKRRDWATRWLLFCCSLPSSCATLPEGLQRKMSASIPAASDFLLPARTDRCPSAGLGTEAAETWKPTVFTASVVKKTKSRQLEWWGAVNKASFCFCTWVRIRRR